MRRTDLIGLGAMLTAAMLGAPGSAAIAQTVPSSVEAWSRGDYAAAVEQWRAPALAGDPDAQFNLGQAYKLGRGVPLDAAAAQDWFLKAARQGHPQAEDNYALALYTAGRKSDAVPWLEKSVARGEARSELVLGTMLFNGDGIPRDVPRAYALMTLASQKGLKSASETLAQMNLYVSAAPTQPALPATKVAAARPPVARAPAKVARAAPKPTPQGAWRIQLGAFHDRANAEGMWGRVRTKLGSARPTYVKAGTVIRLQAAGYASKADAQRACAAAATSCVIAAP